MSDMELYYNGNCRPVFIRTQ